MLGFSVTDSFLEAALLLYMSNQVLHHGELRLELGSYLVISAMHLVNSNRNSQLFEMLLNLLVEREQWSLSFLDPEVI